MCVLARAHVQRRATSPCFLRVRAYVFIIQRFIVIGYHSAYTYSYSTALSPGRYMLPFKTFLLTTGIAIRVGENENVRNLKSKSHHER